MGTNFYLKNPNSDPPEEVHIAKRSSAGLYCWDCNATLCKDGEEGVHKGESQWFEVCPSCRKSYEVEPLTNSTAGRELGFNKNPPKRKKGVSSCASISWVIPPEDLESKVKEFQKASKLPMEHYFENVESKVIVDEYDRKFSIQEFKDILEECPIVFKDMIGREFC